MNSSLLFSIALATIGFGFIGTINILVSYAKEGKFSVLAILFFAVLGFGLFLLFMGIAYLITADSGVWKEIGNRTSFLQRVLGSVPIIEKSQYPPIVRLQSGLAIGISMLAIGAFFVFYPLLFPGAPRDKSSLAVIFFVQGILIIIFSIIYLSRKKD